MQLALDNAAAPYAHVFGEITRYLQSLERRGRKPNFEKQLSAKFARAQSVQRSLAKTGAQLANAHLHALMPDQGLMDNTVNRLLLMAGSEHHWRSVPSAFYVEMA